MKPQYFAGGSLTEQPDGSGILEVRTARGQALLIHFAPHVYADLGFLFYQKHGKPRVVNAKTQNDERRKADWAEVRVSRG